MSRSQRKLRNLMITPRFQLRMMLYYVSLDLFFFGIIIGVAWNKLASVRELMNDHPVMNLQIQNQVNDLMFQMITFTFVAFLVYILVSTLFALVLSHRIAGPVIVIRRYIEELKQGNYDYQRDLRSNDELREIMDGLKELATVLKDREKSR